MVLYADVVALERGQRNEFEIACKMLSMIGAQLIRTYDHPQLVNAFSFKKERLLYGRCIVLALGM